MLAHVEEAFELAQTGRWADALDAAAGVDGPLGPMLLRLFRECQTREADLARLRADRRHELANMIAIALANLEALADGTLAMSPERLNNVILALRQAGELLDSLKDFDGKVGQSKR